MKIGGEEKYEWGKSGRVYMETPRLLIRDWKREDLFSFTEMNADPDVMEYFLATLSPEESRDMLGRITNEMEETGFGLYAVEEKESGDFIGFTGFHHLSFDIPFVSPVEIGWRIRAAYWNKGYATEAAMACLNYAKQKLPFKEVCSFTALLNKRSERVMQKIGMRKTGEFDHPAIESAHPLQRHILYKLEWS